MKVLDCDRAHLIIPAARSDVPIICPDACPYRHSGGKEHGKSLAGAGVAVQSFCESSHSHELRIFLAGERLSLVSGTDRHALQLEGGFPMPRRGR